MRTSLYRTVEYYFVPLTVPWYFRGVSFTIFTSKLYRANRSTSSFFFQRTIRGLTRPCDIGAHKGKRIPVRRVNTIAICTFAAKRANHLLSRRFRLLERIRSNCFRFLVVLCTLYNPSTNVPTGVRRTFQIVTRRSFRHFTR